MATQVVQEEPRLSRRRWSSAFGVDATIALLTFLIMTGVALLGALPLDWPRPVPATAPPTEFSSARALEHIRAIAQQPHLMGSPANAAGFDARHPKVNNIYYALNADTRQAIWASDYLVDAWTAQFLGADAKKGSVADYLDKREVLHSQAPTVALAAPNVALLDDRTRDGVRTLRMRVTAPPKAKFVVTADAAQVVGLQIDGKRVSEELLNKKRGQSAWTLIYWNPPAEGVDLTLDVKGTEPLTITVRA